MHYPFQNKKQQARVGRASLGIKNQGIANQYIRSVLLYTNSNMNIEGTPIKVINDQTGNQYYGANFTSGKKLKGINQDAFGANRKQIPNKVNYTPFINIMQPSNVPPPKNNPQQHNFIEVQIQRIETMCQQKSISLNQIMRANCKERLNEALLRLKETRFGRQRQRKELIQLKKYNLKMNRQLDMLKQKTQSQVEYMRQFIKKQEQGMYQTNRLIFKAEKEKESIKQQFVKMGAKTKEIEQITQIKEKYLQTLLEEQAALDNNYQQKRHYLQLNSKCLYQQVLQGAVLKMQINPHLRVGFQAIHGQQSAKKKILEKNPNIWQKKNKVLTKAEMKYYILMQLYPSWRKLLDRLSYQFVGYKQLLFQTDLIEADILKDLDQYIFTSAMKKIVSKVRSFIVIYSPLQQTYQDMIQTMLELKGLNNGIIRINNITVEKGDVEQLIVSYDFKEESKVKVFEIVRLKELTRQSLIGYIPKGVDKTVLMKIQIPFCFQSLTERIKMQEIYRLIQRQK